MLFPTSIRISAFTVASKVWLLVRSHHASNLHVGISFSSEHNDLIFESGLDIAGHLILGSLVSHSKTKLCDPLVERDPP